MSRVLTSLIQRLSLREPQRRSLETLHAISEQVALGKDTDPAATLAAVRAAFPDVTDFERAFPSLCFALATGVGKTRLMGAFIAYLYLTKRSRHFFVLAPNLTIYEKLMEDFRPGTRKYVFQGVSEFATTPPVVITGDDYESGRGVRDEVHLQRDWLRAGSDAAHINVFNISKIDKDMRAKSGSKMKRLNECIGQSYFDYLSQLPDLVLLMDEAHRYRGSAGWNALNELRPMLGLELTATPFTEETGGKQKWFKNVAYGFGLAEAIRDGFVKEPAVATRLNFKATDYTPEQLERIKLEDAIRLHEQVKLDLIEYASETGRPRVKPFVLVVASDTKHAAELLELISAPAFFGGRYATKVIRVDSEVTGEQKDEFVRRLLKVEQTDEPTEIVIHVNKLKEGWDVTNLYTIVPLRAANARTLVEQSIGRGLRLPYGGKTGRPAVDRLTIVAHDRFQEVINEANRPESVIRKLHQIILDPAGAADTGTSVTVPSAADSIFADEPPPVQTTPSSPGTSVRPAAPTPPPRDPIFAPLAARAIARATKEVSTQFEHLASSAEMTRPEIQAQIVEKVKESLPAQLDLQGLLPTTRPGADPVEAVVAATLETLVALTIDVPNVVVQPVGEVRMGFDAFTLDTSGVNLLPVEEELLVKHLQSQVTHRVMTAQAFVEEQRLEDYVVRAVLAFDDVTYDHNAALLYGLAGQLVTHLRSYLKHDEAVKNVLLYHQERLGKLVHSQMDAHRWERATAYEATATKGFRTLGPQNFTLGAGEDFRDVRTPVTNRSQIRQMVFNGLRKCLYPAQKFDSDPERRFAVVLEDSADVLKWVKPASRTLQILFRGGEHYEPDFLVETRADRALIEVKAANEMDSPEVLDKRDAAIVWCRQASQHTQSTDKKPWRYAMIPAEVIADNMTYRHLMTQYECVKPRAEGREITTKP